MFQFPSGKMATCMICEDEVTKENPIFACVGCDIKVHKFCYGIKESAKNWKCSPCRMGKTGFVKCQLCLQKGDPMKQANGDRWVHVICALFTEGVKFSNKNTMEPVDLSNVSASKRNKRCALCYTSQGYCSTCSFEKCKANFHITCAQKHKLLREIVDSNDDSVAFEAYCKEHVSYASSLQLSSGAVQNGIDKKREKVLKTKSATEDAEWILNDIVVHSTPNTSHKTHCE